MAIASSLLEDRAIEFNEIDEIDEIDEFNGGLRGVRAYRSELDGNGRMVLTPLARYPLTAEDVLRLVYRRMWEATLSISADFPQTDESLAGDDPATRRAYWWARWAPVDPTRYTASRRCCPDCLYLRIAWMTRASTSCRFWAAAEVR